MGELSDDIDGWQASAGLISVEQAQSRKRGRDRLAEPHEAIGQDYGLDFAWQTFSEAYPELRGRHGEVPRVLQEIVDEGGTLDVSSKKAAERAAHQVAQRLLRDY